MANRYFLDKTGLSYFWGKIKSALQGKLDKTATASRTEAIPYGVVDGTSTNVAYTATVPGITELKDGTAVLLKNGVVTSAANFTININGLGAKPAYSNMAAATRETTAFNVNYTILFIYDSSRVEGGCWIYYRGYYSDANTIGYQLRTNSGTLPASAKFYRYRMLFTSADGTKWVPSNTSTSTNATAKRDVIQTPINPFGPIVYYGTTAVVEADANVSAAALWQQYVITLGYSFNRTGAALTLTFPAPIYLKCAPQSNGSAIIDATTPYVQALPSTDDGKIYIFLGIAYSATNIELRAEHPIYQYKDGAIRLWTNAAAGSSVAPATASPLMDGTAAVGSSAKYAREDHVHPTDTSRVPTRAESEWDTFTVIDNSAEYGEIWINNSTNDEHQNAYIDLISDFAEIGASSANGSGSVRIICHENSPTPVDDKPVLLLTVNDYAGTAVNMVTIMEDSTEIHNVITPTANGDAANKGYVDTQVATKQATLVSGTNIKTINGNSLLGSGNLTVGGLPSVSASDNGKVLTVVNGAWAAASLPVYDGTVE